MLEPSCIFDVLDPGELARGSMYCVSPRGIKMALQTGLPIGFKMVYCSKILVLVKLSAAETCLEQSQQEPELLKAEACVELLGFIPPNQVQL